MTAALRLAGAALLVLALAAPASAAPGDADTTFGADGYVTAAPGAASSLAALALAGERIVGAGTSTDLCTDVTLAAWRGDGALDATFGAGGIQVAPFRPCHENEEHGARVAALAVAPSGRLLTAGGWQQGAGDGRLVTAHLADGAPDPAFDGDGFVVDRSERGDKRAVAALPDGRVVAGGHRVALGRTNWEAQRYLASGELDPSFDGDGEIVYPWAAGGPQDTLEALVLDGADGAFVAAGTAAAGEADSDAVVIGRVRADGSLDPAFGDAGRTRVAPTGREARGLDLVRTADGGYVVAGTSFAQGSSQWLLYGFDADGDLDQTFGAAGRVDGPAGSANAIAADGAGRLLVAGELGDGTFAVARYLVNGALDDTFGDGGIATVDFPGDATGADDASVLHDVLVQPDGRIVVGGTLVVGGSTRMGVARLHGGDEQRATSDGVVVDGDGDGAGVPGAQPAPAGRQPVLVGPVASLQSGGRVTITILSSRVTRRGVLVRVRWPQGTDGSARARLWTRNKGILLGQRTVRARPGTIGRRFRVPLNRRGRRLLQGARRLKVVATVRVSGTP